MFCTKKPIFHTKRNEMITDTPPRTETRGGPIISPNFAEIRREI